VNKYAIVISDKGDGKGVTVEAGKLTPESTDPLTASGDEVTPAVQLFLGLHQALNDLNTGGGEIVH